MVGGGGSGGGGGGGEDGGMSEGNGRNDPKITMR